MINEDGNVGRGLFVCHCCVQVSDIVWCGRGQLQMSTWIFTSLILALLSYQSHLLGVEVRALFSSGLNV